jgi:hypothetical protein
MMIVDMQFRQWKALRAKQSDVWISFRRRQCLRSSSAKTDLHRLQAPRAGERRNRGGGGKAWAHTKESPPSLLQLAFHGGAGMPCEHNQALPSRTGKIIACHSSAVSKDIAPRAKLARQSRWSCGTLVGIHANIPAIDNANAIDRSVTANTAPTRGVSCSRRQTGNEHNCQDKLNQKLLRAAVRPLMPGSLSLKNWLADWSPAEAVGMGHPRR